jgi:putative ABC transport system permease protein
VTLKEHAELKSRIENIEAACFIAGIESNVEYLDNLAENLQIWGVSEEFEGIRSFDIEEGRFLTGSEINSGRSVCVIGNSIADDLFRGDNPIGHTIRFQNKKCTVIGVFTREGKSLLNGGSIDKVIVTPVTFFATFADLRSGNANPQIWVKPNNTVAVDALKDELQVNMRSIRRLSPRVKNNFALNKTSMMTTMIDQIFGVVNIAGWIIGIFAVLVGAFGIANIMFVSVKERTRIIGIQKALGAKNFYIILEVLNESVTLSILGGSLGLFLIFLGTLIARAKEFEIYLSGGNIIFGLLISSTVGVIAGLLPALTAAKLDPVKAIASTF